MASKPKVPEKPKRKLQGRSEGMGSSNQSKSQHNKVVVDEAESSDN
jgi:hypothetical protein